MPIDATKEASRTEKERPWRIATACTITAWALTLVTLIVIELVGHSYAVGTAILVTFIAPAFIAATLMTLGFIAVGFYNLWEWAVKGPGQRSDYDLGPR